MNVRTIGITVIVVALVAAFTGIASADPAGAEGTAGSHVTKASATAGNDSAQGGDIAEFNLAVLQQTTKWQGYYGTMTTGITLDDNNAATMYNWTTATPAGEVYATTMTGVPAWTTFNHSVNALSNVDTAYGFVADESDNTANTFATTHTAFHLAGNAIAAGVGQCAKTYENNSSASWETVILWDNNGTATTDYLFAGIIRDNTPSYKNTACDYQMIIPENPSSGTTPYYFYAEIT